MIVITIMLCWLLLLLVVLLFYATPDSGFKLHILAVVIIVAA